MGPIFERIYRGAYTRIYPDYLVELRRALGTCRTILDVGCGKTSLLRYLPKEIYSEGVEAYEPYLEESKRLDIHNRYHKMDVLEIGSRFKERSFECVYAGDVIEHLEKDDGLRLLSMMEKIASRKVIVYTPNGFLPLGERDGNELYKHKSGWEVYEMRAFGYAVIGMSGWKTLRGDDTGVRFRPKFVWRIVSDITQVYTKSHPELAKQMLCIKNVG